MQIKDIELALQRGALLVDVSESDIYQKKHLANAKSLPFSHMQLGIADLAISKEQEILVCCADFGHSLMAKVLLLNMGYRNVTNIGNYETLEENKGEING